MTDFPDAIAAQIRGATVRLADLVRFDFASGEKRIWSGVGNATFGGEVWEGIGNLGRLSAINSGPGEAVDEVTYSLFGDAKLLEKFTDDAEEATGREVRQYLQFFDARQQANGVWVDWTPLDSPFQVFWGIMGPLVADRPPQAVGSSEPRARTLSVRAANALYNRRKPSYGFYSHRDQLGRSVNHNDTLLIFMSRMATAHAGWPKF